MGLKTFFTANKLWWALYHASMKHMQGQTQAEISDNLECQKPAK